MDFSGFNWSLLTIVGPILLGGVILFAVLRNRVSKNTIDKSEAATRDLYKEEDAAHRNDGNGTY